MAKKSNREMLINYVSGEECRIAIVEDGKLEELYQERASAESHVGNIYKGKVTNVEPSIQAAFIDFGLERNGFLHITDLHPQYFGGKDKEDTETVGLKTPRRDRPPIQKCLKRGQEILVQVLKEGIGTKGPTLTSYLSVPGRYIVMMPFMEKMGVSRKVEDEEERREMRKLLNELNPPKDCGFIIRTAGMGQTKADLKRDLAFLQRVWKNIDQRRKKIRVGELYSEADLLIRTIRDVYSSDIDQLIIDDPQAARRAQDFLNLASPRSASTVLYYQDNVPLFHRYDLERQIDTITARTVDLPGGGSLVIDSTEALVAIDVNSGKMRSAKDAETTAYKTNIEACDEVCRQLRLRDLGGVIVIDLIDMRETKKRRAIENRFRDNLKNDRARTRINAISTFGLLEMTRQRMRPSLRKSIYVECPACLGQGSTKSPESTVLQVMRELALVMNREDVARIDLTISPDVAFQVLNRKRTQLVDLEQRHRTPVMVRVNAAGPVDFMEITAYNEQGTRLDIKPAGKLGKPDLIPVGELAETDLSPDGMQPIEPMDLPDYEPSDFEEAATEAGQELDAERDVPDNMPTGDGEDDAESNQKSQNNRGSDNSSKADDQDDSNSSDAASNSNRNDGDSDDEDGDGTKKRRRRRRRRGGRGRRNRGGNDDSDNSNQESGNSEQSKNDDADSDGEPDEDKQPDSNESPSQKKPRRTNRSRKKKVVISEGDDIHEPGDVNGNVKPPEPHDSTPSEADESIGNRVDNSDGQGDDNPKRKRRRRGGRGRGRSKSDQDQNNDVSQDQSSGDSSDSGTNSTEQSSDGGGDGSDSKQKKKPRRRSKQDSADSGDGNDASNASESTSDDGKAKAEAEAQAQAQTEAQAEAQATRKRSLTRRRKLQPGRRIAGADDYSNQIIPTRASTPRRERGDG